MQQVLRFVMIPAFLLAGLSGCAQSDNAASEDGGEAGAEAGAGGSGGSAIDSAMGTGAPAETAEENRFAPTQFQRTAWRATSEEGARYTTYINADGTYRDLRNGDPYQTGTWRFGTAKELCFTPDETGHIGACWKPGFLDNGVLPMTREDGHRIEVTQIQYLSPDQQIPDDSPEDAPNNAPDNANAGGDAQADAS